MYPKPQKTADPVKFTEEILNGKLLFLCGVISSRDHCQRFSPSQISNKPQAGFECAQNLSSGFAECNCAVVITITPNYGATMKVFYCAS